MDKLIAILEKIEAQLIILPVRIARYTVLELEYRDEVKAEGKSYTDELLHRMLEEIKDNQS